jgi:hypothetical protein
MHSSEQNYTRCPQKMCEIKGKCAFIEQEKPAWLVSSMDDQNFSPGVSIIYHIPRQAPFITHHRSGWHPVRDFCFQQHRFWRFGSSRLIDWVAGSLIHDLLKECTAFFGGTWKRSWLRHCATSWKVVDSIPDDIIGFFHWHNPSGRTLALGLTQPLTEMSTRNISWW